MNSRLKQRQRDDSIDNKTFENQFHVEAETAKIATSFRRAVPHSVPIEVVNKPQILKAIGGSIGPFVAFDSIMSFLDRHKVSIIQMENDNDRFIFIIHVKYGFNVSYFDNMKGEPREIKDMIFGALVSLGYEIEKDMLDMYEQQILEEYEEIVDEHKEIISLIQCIRDLQEPDWDELRSLESHKELVDAIFELKDVLNGQRAWEYCAYPYLYSHPISISHSEYFEHLFGYDETLYDTEIVLVDNGEGIIIQHEDRNLYDQIIKSTRVHYHLQKISDILWEN